MPQMVPLLCMNDVIHLLTVICLLVAPAWAVSVGLNDSPPGLPISQPPGGPSFGKVELPDAIRPQLNAGQYPVCDVAFDSTLCFFNQQHGKSPRIYCLCKTPFSIVLLPDARPHGLVGRYTFDMTKPLDSSGSRNHALGPTVAGSPWGNIGASAVFRKNYILIPHSSSFETTDYSVSFWIYRLQDEKSKADAAATPPLERWCPSESIANVGTFNHSMQLFIRETRVKTF